MSWNPQKGESVSVTCPKCGNIIMKSRKDGNIFCIYCKLREKSSTQQESEVEQDG